ncbi:MAG: hypothetical protein P0Y49_04735 [Candidatus Pedobacter colombiensis]|uniref:Uncharacterized protein n=1 Tax=Candidatus Pedobacter colombiensis TaxID=3121371 RepID=A0AAJ5WAM0_9SPHI|nr:hypothetical protein [Pedobacter sp.]WEK20443.1 MAG: hypothetical protein P0Y49_04735 [Pedobacter sp.]
MKIQINISVRNPEWRWEEDDYQKEWLLINGDKMAKYLPSVTFGFDTEVQQYVKPTLDEHTFKFISADQKDSPDPVIQEVLLKDLDVTQFIFEQGSTPVIVSKSILHHVMAAQNQGKGKFYWYYFINEDAEYVQCKSNIWLSTAHFEELECKVPDLDILV